MSEMLDYARRGRNGWWRYLVTLAIAIVATIALGVVILLAVQLSGLAPPDLAQQLVSPTRPAAFFAATGVMFAALAGGTLLGARWVQGKRPGDLLGRWRWSLVGAGAAIWSLVMVANTTADSLLAPGSITFTASPATGGLVVAAVLGLIPQVFCEELIFRGLITQGLLLGLRRELPAAVVSGLIFGAMHIPNGAPQAVSAVAIGIGGAWIAIRTGGLALTFGLHLVNNLFGAVVVASADDVFKGMPALMTQRAPQLLWWDVAFAAAAICIVAAWAGRLNIRRKDDHSLT